MPATVAALVCLIVIVALIRADREGASPALWIPVAWLSIGASREPSAWLYGLRGTSSAREYLSGNLLDQLVVAGLIVAGLVILAGRSRSRRAVEVNLPLLAFLAYAMVSVLWSDFPDVAIKRWTKALGNVVMVLVVVTDRDPAGAFKAVLGRTGFVLLPMSVLLIKYYPHLGRTYSSFSGAAQNIGVALQKNSLGHICLIFGLYSLWQLMPRPGAVRLRSAARIAAYGAGLAMVLWLLAQAGAATSSACLALGALVLLLTGWSRTTRLSPARVHATLAVVAWLGLLGFLTDVAQQAVGLLGRDATLTGRTELWSDVVALAVDPVFGAGFESFWLGARADVLWNKFWWHPNQAHNGYLEMYLNLGWIGLTALLLLLAWGYCNIVRALARGEALGRLRLAYFLVALVYNFTEAAFTVMQPVWIVFLLSIAATPGPGPRRTHRGAP